VSNVSALLPEQAKTVSLLDVPESVHPVGVESQVVLETGKVACPQLKVNEKKAIKKNIFVFILNEFESVKNIKYEPTKIIYKYYIFNIFALLNY
jgi:hypothetical protein